MVAEAQSASLGELEEHRLPRWQVGDVPGAGELVRNVLRCLQLAQLNQAIAGRGQRVGDQLRCLGVSLRGDDGRLLLLLGLQERGRDWLYSIALAMSRGRTKTKPGPLRGDPQGPLGAFFLYNGVKTVLPVFLLSFTPTCHHRTWTWSLTR